MNNQVIPNPNDYKVVEFHNDTDFLFTPEMGCMYDGRPIFGISGEKGVAAGERMSLPYHIGHRLAMNLAKQVQIRKAPPHDPKDTNPIGTPLWTDASIEELKGTFITELYSEERATPMSETDLLMAKYEELKALITNGGLSPAPKAEQQPQPPVDNDHVAEGASQFPAPDNVVYKDKAEVMAELNKRGIKYNARDTKATLEKLLA